MDFMIIVYFLALFLCLGALWLSGDLSVRYSVETASKFNLSTLFIGFVLIAVSTGLPELSVIISSLFLNVHAISVGTILGSNVCDISLVLGLAVLFGGTLYVKPRENFDSIIMLLISAFAMIIVFVLGTLTRITGVLLILLYAVSIWWLWQNRTKKETEKEEKIEREIVEELDPPGPKPFWETKTGVILKLLGSVVLVLISSELSVRVAIQLTKLLNLSLSTVGATIFAVGTSLPELSLALNAAKKKQYALAIGNSLGSVLEQGTLLLGLLAVFSSKPIDIRPLRSLLPFMLASFGIIGFGMIKRKKINRIEGVLMLIVFVSFLAYQFIWVR